MRILAVNDLAVNGALPLDVESKSVLYTQYSVEKCLVHFMKRLTRSPCFSRSEARQWCVPQMPHPGAGLERVLTYSCIVLEQSEFLSRGEMREKRIMI